MQTLTPEEEALLHVARKLEKDGTFFISELADEMYEIGCVEAEYRNAIEGHDRHAWRAAQEFLEIHPDPLAAPTLRRWLAQLRTHLRDNPALVAQQSAAAKILELFISAYFRRPKRRRGRPGAAEHLRLQDERTERIFDWMVETLADLKAEFDRASDICAADLVPPPRGNWPWPRNCWGDPTDYKRDLMFFLRAVVSREMSVQEAAAGWLARTEPVFTPDLPTDSRRPVAVQSPLEAVRALRARIRSRKRNRGRNS